MSYNTIISTAALAAHLHDPAWIVFDCRFALANPEAGWLAYRFGHLPNARYAHLDNDLSSPITPASGRHPLPDFELLAIKLGQWGVSNASQVVVYDDAGGAFAGRMWWLLRCLGHDAVAVLDGSIKQWQKERRALSTEPAAVTPREFKPAYRSGQWLTAAELQIRLQENAVKLIDARTAERFRGEQEPIDPVAGHIPGAINRPLQLNLDSEGLFLSAAQLRQQFSALLGGVPPERCVHMCGSGVTACHNALAMEIAGLQGSKLYAGSWSEWIRDPNRATATG